MDCPVVLEYVPDIQLEQADIAPELKVPAEHLLQLPVIMFATLVGTIYTKPLPVLYPAVYVLGADPNKVAFQTMYRAAAKAPSELVES